MAITIGIEEYRNRYRLRLPKHFPKRYLSTGIEVSNTNFRQVQKIAWDIEEKLNKTSQISWEELKQMAKPQIEVITTPSYPLIELWDMYTEYKKAQISPSTYKCYIGKWRRQIKDLPGLDSYLSSYVVSVT